MAIPVRDIIETRIARTGSDPDPSVRLPSRLKPDKPLVRTGLMARLASSRHFAYGDRAGVLRAAGRRSGRPFRLDVRQRVIVKALVSRHAGKGAGRGAGLARHLTYLQRAGAGQDGRSAEVFDADRDRLDPHERAAEWAEHRHHFRLIISPEHGDRIHDLRDYVRDVMGRVSDDLGEPGLPWMAVCHFDTDQAHAHVLMPGRRADGRDLVIPRDYIGYGLRGRAQEVAQERLGDLSREDAERRIWKETQADRFTAFDRRLTAAADADGRVSDAEGHGDPWSALTRARLARLEALGLARRDGRSFILSRDLGDRLRKLQVSRDVIRTLNQRRLQTGAEVRVAQTGRLVGRVRQTGFHDELGAEPWALVQSAEGEVYVRMAPGQGLTAGRNADLVLDARGIGRVAPPRGRDLAR